MADIFVGIVAIIVGYVVFTQLHGKWFHGGWMQLFGDPPSLNPAYKSIRPLFIAAPFVSAGIVAGLLAGVGLSDWWGLLPRLTALIILFIALGILNTSLAFSVFLPSIGFSFLISATTAYIHTTLLSKRR